MLHRTSIGLDVHARSIAAAAFIPGNGRGFCSKSFGCDADAVVSWAKARRSRRGASTNHHGLRPKRKLDESGLECLVGAVSKTIRPSGDRVKTDKRDAVFLARMLAVGNVVECRMPDAATEAPETSREYGRIAAKTSCAHATAFSKFLLQKGHRV